MLLLKNNSNTLLPQQKAQKRPRKDIAWKQGFLQPKNSNKTLLCCTRSRKSKLASKERLTKCALLKVLIVLRTACYISFFPNLLQVKHFTLKVSLFSQKCTGAVICLLVSAPDTFFPLNIHGVFFLSFILQGTVYSHEHDICVSVLDHTISTSVATSS